MSKVAVVTDSTVNIPADLANGFPISVAPLQLIWGDKTYRDSIDIQPTEFYNRLKDAKVMPTTSQPSPAVYSEIYRGLLDQGYDILCMCISARLSGTVASANQAKENYPGARIEVLDSETTSMALGYNVLTVARAAMQGATLSECKTLAEKGRANSGVLFLVSTLEFLRRGGRIGGAAAFLGTALNLKPILELRNGRIEAVERVRTMSKAMDRLLDLFEERVDGRKPLHIAALHANAPQEAAQLLERASQRFGEGDVVETAVSEVSPVIGTHTGPGCVGLAYLASV